MTFVSEVKTRFVQTMIIEDGEQDIYVRNEVNWREKHGWADWFIIFEKQFTNVVITL